MGWTASEREAAVASGRSDLAVSCAAAVLVVSMVCVGAPLTAQQLNVTHYTARDGIPQRQVFAAHQDRIGYLWFGTYGGLSRYDGREFRTYTTDDGLTSNSIVRLGEDADGHLLVGTTGGLCRLVEEEFTCVGSEEGVLLDDAVNDFLVVAGGQAWIATDGGLSLVSLDQRAAVRHLTEEDGLPSSMIHAVVLDESGALWVGSDGGLARLDGREIVAVAPDVLEERSVEMLLLTSRGLLVGTDHGLFIWRQGNLSTVATSPELSDAFFSGAREAADGTIWIASHRGVLRLDESGSTHLSEDNGLLSSTVYGVLVDREENVWFVGEEGASKLVPGPLVAFDESDGLPHPFVRALAQDRSARLWAGTRRGVAVFDEETVVDTITVADGLPHERVYSLAPVAGDGMLIGTLEGLALWRRGRIEHVYGRRDGLPHDYVPSLLADGRGGAWVGTSSGLARWRPDEVIPVRGVPVLEQSYILAMDHDDQGRLWLGLRNDGVAVYTPRTGRVNHLDAEAGLTDLTVWSVARDPGGGVWVGTNGDGAYHVDGSTIRHLTTDDGLVNDFVWQVRVDSTGAVWFYTNQGLDRLRGHRFEHFGYGDGLIDLEGSTNAVLETSRGVLWFGTGRGLVRFDAAQEERNTVPPPVIVEAETDGGAALGDNGSIEYDGSRRLVFAYTALTFRDESAVRYRFRLLGLDDGWSEPTADRTTSYAALDPGRYRFEVEAVNGDGVWSAEPAAIDLSITPLFWQTGLFKVLLGLLGLALVAGVVTFRTRKLEADRRRLEAKVAERTAELQQKNRELRELANHDELTGLANRRAFYQKLDEEIRKLSRSPAGIWLSLFIVDLDHFKPVNDRHGHLMGDRLLMEVASRLQSSMRSTDLVARYGGEEFAVLVPMTDPAGARVAAEKARRAIGDSPFVIGGREIAMTASVGIASLGNGAAAAGDPRPVDTADTADVLIGAADSALYRAKESGRNRVELGRPLCMGGVQRKSFKKAR